MSSDSMAPTIKDKESIVVDYSVYIDEGPKRWDAVTYESVTDGSTWLHRVVGLPDETIEIVDGRIRIDGQFLSPPSHISTLKYEITPQMKITFPYSIPKDHYFLLGDNSPMSDDSRFNGPIHRNKIIGRVKNK